MNECRVTNGNSFPLPGRFAGVDYTFPPDEPVDIPLQAARHIFQLGQDDKRRALAQLGILKGTVSYEAALAVLKKVKFVEGHMAYDAQQQGPGGGQQTPQPGQKPGEQPGQKPGEHKPDPSKEKHGPGKDEENEESEESGGRPGAPRNPGRKSEGEVQTSSSDDLAPAKRKW